MAYEKRTLIDNETVIDKDLLDYMQDGIAAAHDEVGILKSAVSEIEEDNYVYTPNKNVFPNNATWVNGTFSSSTGELLDPGTGLSNAAIVDYIAVTAEEAWTISWKAKDLNCTMYVVAYDSDKAFLGETGKGSMNAVARAITFTTLPACAYIRFRIYRNGAVYTDMIPEEVQVEKGSVATEYEPNSLVKTPRIGLIDAEIEGIKAEIEEINEGLDAEQTRVVMSDKNLLEKLEPGYLTNEGVFNTTTSGWRRSDYIPVEPGQFIYFHNVNNFSYFGYFDSNKTWIGGKNIETPVVTDAAMLCIHQAPANAKYIVVSLEDTKMATCWGNYTPTVPTGNDVKANPAGIRSYEYFPTNPCDYEGLDVCAFRKGICIGDSITGGGFNYNSGTNPWSDGNVYSYPSQFQKMTGIEMTNEGHSGKTTVQWWNIYGTGGEKAIDFSGYDFAIIHLGINDVSYNIPTADTQTAYQNIIDALKAANQGIKIFVCTIIPAYADAIVAEKTYGTVNDMIARFSEQENVYLCDLTTYGHVYVNSEYTAGHLTAYGYWRMAKDLMGYIGSIMRKYPSDFRFIHFIGTDMTYQY